MNQLLQRLEQLEATATPQEREQITRLREYLNYYQTGWANGMRPPGGNH